VGMGIITTGTVGDRDKSCPRAALYQEHSMTVAMVTFLCHLNHMTYKTNISDNFTDNNNNKLSPKSLGKSVSPPLMAENAFIYFVCYQLCNAHCRRVQSLSCGYATSTPQCHMQPIRYIVLSDSPLLKKNKKQMCLFPKWRY